MSLRPMHADTAETVEADSAIGGVLPISVRRQRRVRLGQGRSYRRGGGTTIVCRVPVGHG
jgi:hypothetical protein